MASLADCPHNQGLPTSAVTSSKHFWDVCAVISIVCLVVGSGVQVDTQSLRWRRLWPQESHGQEAEIAGPNLFRSGHFSRPHSPVGVLDPLDSHSANTLQLPILPNELLGIDKILS